MCASFTIVLAFILSISALSDCWVLNKIGKVLSVLVLYLVGVALCSVSVL